MSWQSETVLPVVEESLVVDKRDVVTGRVVVSTRTELVDELASLDLRSESVDVERVPFDVEITEAPQVRIEGDVTIVPVVEERLVVEKRLVLVEELRITRRVTSEHVETPVTLRKQRAVIERIEQPNALSIEEEISP